jgi:GT2 family glycosyltransferase
MAVGGDAVYRCRVYRDAGEFDPSVAAGEEPELCKRIRDRGWKVWRLEDEMTVHHAGINHLSQWWRRHFRTGYAGYDVERRFQLGLFDRIIKSAFFWGVAAPLSIVLIALALAKFVSGWWAIGFFVVAQLGIIVQVWRVARQLRARRYNWNHSLQFGFFTMAAKVPIVCGVVRQVVETAFGRRARLVEYKQPQSPSGSLSARPRR